MATNEPQAKKRAPFPHALFLCLSLLACSGVHQTEWSQEEIPGTLTGYCFLIEGDLMPGTSRATKRPLATLVSAYEYDPNDRWKPDELPPTAPVASTSSDSNGQYSFLLPPGQYVLCISWKGTVYCRGQATVYSGNVTERYLFVYGKVVY